LFCLDQALALLGLNERHLVVDDGFVKGPLAAEHLVAEDRVLLFGQIFALCLLEAHKVCVAEDLESIVAQVGAAGLQVLLATTGSE